MMKKETNRNMSVISPSSLTVRIPRVHHGLIWNFFHLSIVLRKSFLRKGIRMSKETRRLIEESRQFELSANSNLVPFPSLCRPADFTDFFPRKKKNSLFRLLIKREILTSREVLCNQFLFCNKDDSKKGFFSLKMSA